MGKRKKDKEDEPKKPTLPNVVFVAFDGDDDDDPWLNAQRDITGFENGQRVGRYELIEVGTKRINHDIAV